LFYQHACTAVEKHELSDNFSLESWSWQGL